MAWWNPRDVVESTADWARDNPLPAVLLPPNPVTTVPGAKELIAPTPPTIPGKSQEQQDIERSMQELIDLYVGDTKESRNLWQLMLPSFMKELGYEAIKDENGRIVDIKELPYTESPALTETIARGDRQLSERMAQNLGPGWETSTPGIQATAERKYYTDTLREDVRTRKFPMSMALPSAGIGISQNFLNAGQQYQPLLASANNERMLNYQNDLNKWQSRQAFQNAVLSAGIGAASGGIMGNMGMLGPGMGAGRGALMGAMQPNAPGMFAMMNYFRQPGGTYGQGQGPY